MKLSYKLMQYKILYKNGLLCVNLYFNYIYLIRKIIWNNYHFTIDISKEIKNAVKDMGFEEPTPIQGLTIPEALEGKDIIGQAQTGTGKTVAFGIPVLEKIFVEDKAPQAIIICPTRELSLQVAKEIGKLSSFMKKLHVLPVYGGVNL